jgi:hypothetical protein
MHGIRIKKRIKEIKKKEERSRKQRKGQKYRIKNGSENVLRIRATRLNAVKICVPC